MTCLLGSILLLHFKRHQIFIVPSLGALFVLYRMSFFSIESLLPIALQGGLVIGVASGLLLWKSRSLLAPILMQLMVQFVIVYRSLGG